MEKIEFKCKANPQKVWRKKKGHLALNEELGSMLDSTNQTN
jgi:hypothetical protein